MSKLKDLNKSTKNSSYLADVDGANWITTFKQLKAIATTNAEKDETAVLFAEPCPNDFLTRDYSEEQAYVRVLGCVLKRTICTQSFCQLCKAVLTTDKYGPEHKFIQLTEYHDGALILPSKDAIEWFSKAEAADLLAPVFQPTTSAQSRISSARHSSTCIHILSP